MSASSGGFAGASSGGRSLRPRAGRRRCAAAWAALLCAAVHGAAQGLVIDHTCTDLGRIPAAWIQEAKARLRIGYGHTSHGSQLVTGLETIAATLGAPYDYTASSWGLEPGRFLNDYWGNAGGASDLGHHGDLAWRDATLDMLERPDNDRNVVIWSWCGGVSDNDAAGIDAYLQALCELEALYPAIRFVYMTGHLDGSAAEGNLNRMNDRIRQYCRAHHTILFDFADIESFDPDGAAFLPLYADDGCTYSGGNWAESWCRAHPGDPRCAPCSCAHSRPLNCNLKGRAVWWMLARLAGWDGVGADRPAPAGVSASDGAFSDRVRVAWAPVAGAAGYEVWRAGPDSVRARQAGPAGVSFDDLAVVPGLVYTYWVKAVAGGAAGPFSASDAGYAGRLPVSECRPADYDGDGRADPALVGPGGAWHAWLSSGAYRRQDAAGLGATGDAAAAADCDGDRRADPIAVRGADWTVWLSGAGYSPAGPASFGTAGDWPVPADYDGDGLADPAVFRAGHWTAWCSGAEYHAAGPARLGSTGDWPVPADYDGDGLADPAVFRAGVWTVWLSGAGYAKAGGARFGAADAWPAPSDYDGDRRADPAVYEPGAGTWTVWPLAAGYGASGPHAFR